MVGISSSGETHVVVRPTWTSYGWLNAGPREATSPTAATAWAARPHAATVGTTRVPPSGTSANARNGWGATVSTTIQTTATASTAETIAVGALSRTGYSTV